MASLDNGAASFRRVLGCTRSEAVEPLGLIVAAAAKDANACLALRFRCPLPIRFGNAIIAGGAPRIGARILGIVSCPEESGRLSISEALDDVLTYVRTLLRAMLSTLDSVH